MTSGWKYLIGAALSLSPIALHGALSGFKVVSGDVSAPIHDGSNFTIHSRTDAILQWDTFSIDADQLVKFQQLSSDSAILNRIVGSEQSALMGQLLSNGKVYVLNPNGVLIGPNAQIVASSFLASTLDVLDEEFLKLKEMRFYAAGDGTIVNLGTIKCPGGDIILLAKSVSNQGTMSAEGGYAGVGIGTEILIRPEGTQRIYVRAGETPEGAKEGVALEHSGQIQAIAAELRAGANPYAKAIHASGEIDATALQRDGGQIYLVAEKGFTEVEGALLLANSDTGNGGAVHVLGDYVSVLDANIDVSGKAGGGEILLGGDFQGKNPDIQNAKRTFVSKETTLSADALNLGNGGKVISWSDEATWFFANAYARGGASGGDGGIVEASGHFLDFRGNANTLAPSGKAGTLFLDPSDITISVGDVNYGFSAAGTPTCSGLGTVYLQITAPTSVNIDATTLGNQLDATCVVVSTDATGNGTNAGVITVSNAVSWGALNAPTTLTLDAAQNIIINASITCASNSALSGINLVSAGIAGLNINTPAPVIGINQAGGAPITTAAGSISFQGVGVGGGVPGVQINDAVTSTSGTITFQNCIGGGAFIPPPSTSNFGVQITATGSVVAPTIFAEGIVGGPGTGGDFGFLVQGQLGSTAATSLMHIYATATGTGAGGPEYGIYVQGPGSVNVMDGGTVTLSGMGGDPFSQGGSVGNYGIYFDNTSVLNLGTVAGATANLMGIGGNGSAGANHGVNFIGMLNMPGSSVLTFNNCIGGNSETSGNFGVFFTVSGFTFGTSPQINFNHCVGGTSTTFGSGLNLGVEVSDVTIPIGATNAAVTFSDICGGFAGVGTTQNYGILFSNLSVLGTAGSITMTNVAGGGVPGSTNNYGVQIASLTTLTARTIEATAIMGGSGSSLDHGLHVLGTLGTLAGPATVHLMVQAAANLDAGANARGILIDSTGVVNISDTGTLTLIGQGGGNPDPTLSSAGGSNIGIDVLAGGQLLIGNAGVGAMATLTGVGGNGNAVSAGTNIGVNFNGHLTMTGANSTLNFFNCIGGIGGSGNNGVSMSPSVTAFGGGSYSIVFDNIHGGDGVTAAAKGVSMGALTIPDGLLSFSNISGGGAKQDTSGADDGIIFAGPVQVTTGGIVFNNIAGGGNAATGTNIGIYLLANVIAPSITGFDIFSGVGSGENYGLAVQAASLGSNTITSSIIMSAASRGSGSNETGIVTIAAGSIQVIDAGEIILSGTGSANLPSGAPCRGIEFRAGTGLVLGSSGAAIAEAFLTGTGGQGKGASDANDGVGFFGTLTMHGSSSVFFNNCSGGTGGGGGHRGVFFEPATVTAPDGPNSINFTHCHGGSGSPGSNVGVLLGTLNLSTSGSSINFFDVAGGSIGTDNYGIEVLATKTVTAPAIFANGILGGQGSDSDHGVRILGTLGTLSSPSTTEILIQASANLGAGDNARGILIDGGGTVNIAGVGRLVMIGQGGGDPLNAPAGASNIGIEIVPTGNLVIASAGGFGASATLTGIGGAGAGGISGANTGINFLGNLTMDGSGSVLNFLNSKGGTIAPFNNGLVFDPNTVTFGTGSYIINCDKISGGDNNSAGVQFGSLTIPNTAASGILNFSNIAGGGRFAAGSSPGILFDTSVQVQSAGSITFNNIAGGGTPSSSSNYGVQIASGATLAAITITGYDISGGPGSGGGSSSTGDVGLFVEGQLGLNTLTTTLDMTAGSMGVGPGEIGIYVPNGGVITVADSGILILNGRGTTTQNSSLSCHGIFFDTGSSLILGSSGASVVNALLSGIGGMNTAGENSGVEFSGAVTMHGSSTLTFDNCLGGTGNNGVNTGVVFAPSSITVDASANEINFFNVSGGSGPAGGNNGVILGSVSLPNAGSSINFFNVAGGSGGTNNQGVIISNLSTVTAETIEANGILGGQAVSGGHGLLVIGTLGTLVSPATTHLFVSASADLNAGANANGILIEGTVNISDDGTLTLLGQGGGNPDPFLSSAGGNNFGIQTMPGSNLAIGNGGAGAFATLTGTGGNGNAISLGSNTGVLFNGQLTMTGADSTIEFLNCTGGIGGPGNSGLNMAPNATSFGGGTYSILCNNIHGGDGLTGQARGIIMEAITIPNGLLSFSNVAGGGALQDTSGADDGIIFFGPVQVTSGSILFNDVAGGGNANTGTNIGVYLLGDVIAPTIEGLGILGGLGVSENYGLAVEGVSLGSNTLTTTLNMSAASRGLGASEIGIITIAGGTIQVADSGTLLLNGQGSANNPTGVTCRGIQINPGTNIVLGNTGAATVAATFTGIGGLASGLGASANDGIGFFGNLTMNGTSSLSMSNCVGGTGNGGSNRGVFFTPANLTAASGPNAINFTNCHGGSGSVGNNVGVNVSCPTLTLGSFSFTDVAGGTGGNNNYGVTLGASLQVTTGTITMNNVSGGHGGTIGSGTNNHGFFLPGAMTISAPTISGAGILGGPGSGTNIGWYVNGGTCGSASTAETIFISCASMGEGASEVGLQVDGGGVIETIGAGTIKLIGQGGDGTGTAGYGVFVTGASSAISSVDGNISVTGVASTLGTAGIQIDIGGAISATGLGTLTLATPTPQPINLGASTLSTNSGNLTLDGRVSSIAATPAITSTSGTILFNEPVFLTATPPTITATSGSIFFNSTVDGAFGFAPTAGTSIRFAGALGSTAPLTSLTVTAPSIVVNANQTVNSSTTHSYVGAVTLTAPVTFTELGSAPMAFFSTIGGNFALTLLAPSVTSSIAVAGAINTSGAGAGASGGSLFASSGGSVNFSGAINTSGSAVAAAQGGAGGDVTVHSLGSITITDTTVSGGAGTTTGGNSGTIFLQPNPAFSTNVTFGTVPSGTILFNGAIFTAGGGAGPTIGNNGEVLLAPLGRTSPMSIATMFTNPMTLDSLTITAGNLIMGPHEALTSFNNVTFNLTGYTALGDVVALNTFTLSSGSVIISPSNYLVPRASQMILKNDGTFYASPTPHLLSGGTFSLTGGVTPAGFNEGKPIAGIALAQLTFMGVPLNLDESTTPPTPPVPPTPPSNARRERQIRKETIASAGELANILVTFVDPRAFWPYWSNRICCCVEGKPRESLPHWATMCLTGNKRRRPRCDGHPERDCHDKRVIQFTPFLHRSDNI